MGLLVIKLILITVVILTSLYSAIVYSARKRESARQLNALRGQAQPLRRLSPEERQALEPFLVRPDRPGKPVRLHSEEVFPLSGEYRRHGVENQGNQTWHHIIGGVEVILPFDAEHFLSHDNQAEVVFADKLAVVVRLNDFELLEGAARDRRRESARNQWEQGDRGALQDIVDNDEEETEDDQAARRRVDILLQRDETEAEILAREGRGLGLLAGLCWTLAFIALALAASRDSLTWLLIWSALALLCAAPALWLIWRPWRPGPPGKVNRVSGYLNLIPVGLDEQTQTVSVAPALGDKFAFQLPDQWRPYIEYEQDQRLELELRVDDYSVVDYNRRFSVDQEYRRHPPVYWGRHLSLALVGLLALVVALLGPVRPELDAAQAGQWLSGAGPLTVNDPARLVEAAPSPGRHLVLDGQGRCQVATDPARLRCDRIRWGGDTPSLPDLEPDPLIRSALAGELVETRRDRSLELMAMLRGGGAGDRRPLVVSNGREVLAAIQELCPDDNTPACDDLRRRALNTLRFPAAPQEQDWDTLRGRLAEEDNPEHREAVALSRQLDNLGDAMARVAQQRLQPLTEQLAGALAEQQRGGVVLSTTRGEDLLALPSGDRAGRKWETLRAQDGEQGLRAFHLEGVLVERASTEDGAPHWVLDPQRVDRDGQALLRVLWVVAALGLLLVHGVLALRGRLAAQRRRRALQREYGG
ncbi:IgaA/UmoB family intracellular growth attenuator [Alloalcanivorax gelatiniphagus]|uniref:Intracellular growth attenuator family protein n=2 Tax=Alloalcanivorax gelatiniphagus TaxID=1194167 RepID=A0ABY2XIW7_9GAMM|nr:IgaA/UmoB family intracellular growth attenuator [Alloalcanivorax gelatiniphagus]TMW11838.1 intracellular growth attenuator family protein [Alloalcanivorax gelatiniphagus]